MRGILMSGLRYLLVYGLLCVGTILLLGIIFEYFSFSDQAGFLKYKQDYLHLKVWKVAFYIHVFVSIFTLIAGFTQFSDILLQNYRKLHRFVGKVYVFNILFINFPSALIMAVYANGLLPSKIAFITLDCLWFYFTLQAFLSIRKKNIEQHKDFMIRSYALTCSAITLRLWQMTFRNLTELEPLTIYMIDAWLGFVPNLLFAEWLIRTRNHQRLNISEQLNTKDHLKR
jgi:hypothetical protein